MTTTLGLLAVVLLIAGNGYFVAAEFGFVAVRRGRLEEEAGAGGRRAGRALAVSKRLSFMLSGAQLGITVTSLVTGYVAEPTIGRALEPLLEAAGLSPGTTATVAFILAFVIATAGQMIFGELAPKNLAIARPEPVAKALAGSIALFLRVFGPLIRLFDGAANRLLRAVGIEPVEELAVGVSADELDFIVEESAREGALTERQAALLTRALDFRELVASEVMVPRVEVATVPVTATGADLRALLATPYTKYPVVAEVGDLDEVVGVVHVEDLLQFPPGERDDVPVRAIVRPPLLVPESADVSIVLDRLRASTARMAVVIDEYGGAAGILTMEDLVEELVGDITDEHDAAALAVWPTGEAVWLVPGGWRIDEVERDTGVVLPEGEYDTVGGLVMHELGRVPAVGDEVSVPGAVLHVREMRLRRVVGVVLTVVAEESE